MSDAAVTKRVRVVAAVVWDGQKLLMTQRPPGGPLGLQWEFPGGKIEPGESAEQALVREVREELGVSCTAGETLATHEHDYEHGVRVELVFVAGTLASHTFSPSHAVHAVRWVVPKDIRVESVLEGDRDFLRALGAR